MKASEFFGGQYMSASEIEPGSKPIQISAITSEVLEGRDGRERERIILHLNGAKKPVVVNATNATLLIEAYGDETDAWVGKYIVISRTKVMFNGSRVDSIKLMPTVVKGGES